MNTKKLFGKMENFQTISEKNVGTRWSVLDNKKCTSAVLDELSNEYTFVVCGNEKSVSPKFFTFWGLFFLAPIWEDFRAKTEGIPIGTIGDNART